jgi:hypothetical protein
MDTDCSLANLRGDNSSEDWEISLVIPFEDCAANSIKRAANRSKYGPIQAVAAANTDPKSCPRVAPAPTKPNNLAPD